MDLEPHSCGMWSASVVLLVHEAHSCTSLLVVAPSVFIRCEKEFAMLSYDKTVKNVKALHLNNRFYPMGHLMQYNMYTNFYAKYTSYKVEECGIYSQNLWHWNDSSPGLTTNERKCVAEVTYNFKIHHLVKDWFLIPLEKSPKGYKGIWVTCCWNSCPCAILPLQCKKIRELNTYLVQQDMCVQTCRISIRGITELGMSASLFRTSKNNLKI